MPCVAWLTHNVVTKLIMSIYLGMQLRNALIYALCIPSEGLGKCISGVYVHFSSDGVDVYSFVSLLKCRHLFFLQAKALFKDGKLPVTQEEAGKIGALLAQAEMGDSMDAEAKNHPMLCYPPYFNDWDVGTARAIAQEHSKLKGQ